MKKYFPLLSLLVWFLLTLTNCTQYIPPENKLEAVETSVAQDTIAPEDSIFQMVLNERLQNFPTVLQEYGLGQGELFEDNGKYSTVPIYYATDRMPSGSENPYEFYSGIPNLGGLQFGKCTVTIPKIHQLGEIERPSWWSISYKEDADKHMILKSVDPISEVNFFEDLHWDALKANRKEALIFIHGFNVSFDDAALRCAQMVYDISFGGIPMLYSWPSRGSTLKYWEDGQNNAATVPNLQYFLEKVAATESIDRIHIVAHSMGNRALTKTLMELAKKQPENPLFGQIILAAPDVDAAEFVNEIAPKIRSTAQNITLYASSKDKALIVSKQINKGPRAGEGGRNLVVLSDIQTVDASLIDTDFLGHSYFANTWLLINDLYNLINKGLPADRRKLKDDRKNQMKYWFF